MRWAFLFALAGCAGGGVTDNRPSPSTLGPDGSTGSVAETGTPVVDTTGDGDDDDSGTTLLPPASTSGLETTTGPPMTTEPADSSSSEGPPMCIVEPEDTECVQCVKQYCCPEYDACTEDENCGCALDCINDGGMAQDCADGCGTSAAVTDLFVCGYLSCQAECEGI